MKKDFIDYPVTKQEAHDMGFKPENLTHFGDTYIVRINADGCENADEVQKYLWAEAKKTQRSYSVNKKAQRDFSDDYSEDEESLRGTMASLDYLAEHGYEAYTYIEKGYEDFLNNDVLYDALKKLEKIKPNYAKYIKAYFFNKDDKYNYEKMSTEFGKAIGTLHDQITRGCALLRSIIEGEI